MSHASDPRFLVLHSLRLKGFAAELAVARLTGLAPPEVDAHLAALHADGLAHRREGRITGWGLTAAGREHHAAHAAADLVRADGRAAVEAAYEEFLHVNQPFLTVCTDWQVRLGPGGEQIVNDHNDAAYDAALIARLREIDVAGQAICVDLSAAMGRFRVYGPRLSEALAKVEAGEQRWFTGALIDSYHTVWFELHEDLLATLGIHREKEGAY